MSGVTVRGVQGAVAVVTARMAGIEVPLQQILGDTPPEEALTALGGLVAHVLTEQAPGVLVAALRAAGACAGQLEAGQ